MSRFAFETLGFHPTYPGHPCTLALLILRKYPRIGDAFVPTKHNWAAALGDSDIPCSGTAVGDALDLIRNVWKGMPPEDAIQWGMNEWRQSTIGAYALRYEGGRAEEVTVLPLLREALAGLAEHR